MRIIGISDTHGFHDEIEIPDGDVLVFAGDFTGPRRYHDVQLRRFIEWMGGLPHTRKILVAGNHDFGCLGYMVEDLVKECLNEGIDYLQDSGLSIDGVTFWGSPWQPEFHNWAYNLKRGKQLKAIWDKIPESTDVLVTHGPPQFILDANNRGDNCGCADLLDKVKELPSLKAHLFGHIHEGYGLTVEKGIRFFNCSVWDHIHSKLNPPTVIDL